MYEHYIEQMEYDPLEMLTEINDAQPEAERLPLEVLEKAAKEMRDA